jgi:hypothetical protein
MKKNNPQSSGLKNLIFFKIAQLFIDHIIILIRRFVKFYLHFVTGKTELERICQNEKNEHIRIKKLGELV